MKKMQPEFTIRRSEIEFRPLHAQGPGGQNVNKVASAVQIFFDIRASSLPDLQKRRLLALRDQRITAEGLVVIKAQSFRSQERNREDALRRLSQLIATVTKPVKRRKPTRPTRSSRDRRLDSKTRHSRTKSLRGQIIPD